MRIEDRRAIIVKHNLELVNPIKIGEAGDQFALGSRQWPALKIVHAVRAIEHVDELRSGPPRTKEAGLRSDRPGQP